MKVAQKLWPWKLLLAAILIVMAAGIWGSVQRIDYEWRWYRVPQYFLFKAEDPVKLSLDGIIERVSDTESTTRISVRLIDGSVQELEVDAGTARVAERDDLFAGDTVGYIVTWRLGPLLTGLWTTMWISAAASVLGLIIGLVAGLMKISKNYTVSMMAAIYVEIIRGTPLLVQIFIAYFFIGTVFNLDRNVAGIGALALFAGAYVAEIVRAGIQSIPKGQMEAARSLGMSTPQAMSEIILPQALKRILPPLSGQFISLIKDSSLVSVIAITDLTKSGREIITSTFATFEIWLVVAAMYLIVTSLLSQFVFYLERRLAISD